MAYWNNHSHSLFKYLTILRQHTKLTKAENKNIILQLKRNEECTVISKHLCAGNTPLLYKVLHTLLQSFSQLMSKYKQQCIIGIWDAFIADSARAAIKRLSLVHRIKETYDFRLVLL